jgi:hypothetical protein
MSDQILYNGKLHLLEVFVMDSLSGQYVSIAEFSYPA